MNLEELLEIERLAELWHQLGWCYACGVRPRPTSSFMYCSIHGLGYVPHESILRANPPLRSKPLTFEECEAAIVKQRREEKAAAYLKANPECKTCGVRFRRNNNRQHCTQCRPPKTNGLRALLPGLVSEQGGQCGICQLNMLADLANIEVDHITPRSKGGSDHPSNLQAVHRSCNLRKGARKICLAD